MVDRGQLFRSLVCAAAASVALVGCGAKATVGMRASNDVPMQSAPADPVDAPTPVAAAPPPDVTVTVARPIDKVGDKYVQRITGAQNFIFRSTSSSFETELVRTRVEECTIEVLAVADGYEMKLRAAFAEENELRIHNGNWKRIESGVAGRTYVVERVEGRLVVTNDKGKTPSKKELQYLEARFANLGRDSGFRSAFGAPAHVGATVPALGAYLQSVMSGRGSRRVRTDGTVVTLSGTRDVDGEACAVFSLVVPVVAEAESDLGREVDETRLRGVLIVRTRDGVPLSMLLEGPSQVRIDTNGISVIAEGKARTTMVVKPL